MEKKIYFLRWGNLNAVKHKESRKVSDNEWSHVAPCLKGIYAFPRGYVERFLLGGLCGNDRCTMLKKPDGSLVTEKELYDESFENIRPEYKKLLKKLHIKTKSLKPIYKDGDFYIGYQPEPKHFEYNGDIWHHLSDYVEKKDIMDEKHGWIKTSYKTYLNALHKCDVSERFQSYINPFSGKMHGNPHTCPKHFTKDHYEVFIEHLK